MPFQYSFFQFALLGLLLISIASAMIGTYILTRRLVAISGGITHACFGGLGLGYFLGISPIAMASVFAIVSSLGVEWISKKHKVREDSAVAVIWAFGMAIGVIFVFLTPGYVPELNSFLFGNILTINIKDIYVFTIFTSLLIAFFLWKFRSIVTCAFDSDFARVSGLPVTFINMTMTIMTAICIVLTIRLVGVMLLMSMLSLPIMTAEVFIHSFKRLIFASVGISLVASVSGLMLSAVIEVPCSALIVMILAIMYLIAKIVNAILSKMQ